MDPVILETSDGRPFQTTQRVASIFGCLCEQPVTMADENSALHLPSPNVPMSDEDFLNVLRFCEYYLDHPYEPIPKPIPSSDFTSFGLDSYYLDFCDRDLNSLSVFAAMAHIFKIDPLLNLVCAKIATCIKGKTPDEIKNLC